jgi:hypothetical protein
MEQSSLGEIWSLAQEDDDSLDWQSIPTQNRNKVTTTFGHLGIMIL